MVSFNPFTCVHYRIHTGRVRIKSLLPAARILGVVLFVAGILYLLSARIIIRPNDFPPLTHEFGVGFHFTPEYGTAVVSHPNGSVVDVAKLNGDDAYKELMFRLSLEWSRRTESPSKIIRWRDLVRFFASADVITLASMTSHLRNEVEIRIGQRITAAVVTVPNLPALYEEDLQDAFAYLRLTYLSNTPYWMGGIFYETAATYVGNGFGLCSNYTDLVGCQEEYTRGKQESILSICYTRTSLTSTMARQRMGFALPESEWPRAVADLRLGCNYRTHNPGEEYYWAQLRDSIMSPYMWANHLQVQWLVSKVLVHGDCALESNFRKFLNETIKDVMENNPPTFSRDPVFAAARGAAEMAKILSFEYQRRHRQEGEL